MPPLGARWFPQNAGSRISRPWIGVDWIGALAPAETPRLPGPAVVIVDGLGASLLPPFSIFWRRQQALPPREESPFPRECPPFQRKWSPFPIGKPSLRRDQSPYPRVQSPFHRKWSSFQREQSPFPREWPPFRWEWSPFLREWSSFPR